VLAVKYYGTVRDFFQDVRAGDEQQIVVARGPLAAKP